MMDTRTTTDSFNEGLIQPSLIKQLQNILEQYPDDGQILKELIQNAEDAGASTIKFLIDHTQYDTKTLASPALKLQQGPALYAYNDAVFTDKDWMGIRMMQDSVKTKDPLKVGRFGLGFKSVFHMTDLPGILSGNQVGFLDPQEEYLLVDKISSVTGHNTQVKTSSQAWQLQPEVYDKHSDQFRPFLHDLFQLGQEKFHEGHYNGTVFRFPLRQKQKSKIIETVYTTEKLRQLFAHFDRDAHYMLLFLKHVHTIEVFEKVAAERPPQLIHQIKIADDVVKTVVEKRQSFVARLQIVQGRQPIVCSYWMTTERNAKDKKDWLVTQLFDTDVHVSQNGESKKNLPLVGVALPIPNDSLDDTPKGHTFCFLPMPLTEDNKTGLNVHVNGYFAVDQNRRHLKWPENEAVCTGGILAYGTTQEHLSNRNRQNDAQWNCRLQEHSLPLAMWELINYAIDCSKRHPEKMGSSEVCQIFPDREMVHENWRPVVEPFWQMLAQRQNSACLYSSLNLWVCPREAYLIRTDDKLYSATLSKIANKARLPIVLPPGHIHQQLVQQRVCQMITPKLIGSVLEADVLTHEERLAITDYLFYRGGCKLLSGKPLLPMENGQTVSFNKSCPVYLESLECKMSLLPESKRKHIMVNCSLDDKYYVLFEKIARTGQTQLCILTPKVIPELLKDMLGGMTGMQSLGMVWLKKLWNFILSQSEIHLFEGLPIVPCTVHQWGMLSQDEPYVDVTDTGFRKSGINKDILQRMGLKLVHQIYDIVLKDQQSVLQRYIACATVSGILDAVTKLPPLVSYKALWNLSDDDKNWLVMLISRGEDELMEGQHKKLLQAMPLLRCYETTKGDATWECQSGNAVKCCADIELPIPMPVKVAKAKKYKVLAKLTGVPILPDTAVLVRFVFPAIQSRCYNKGQVESIMKKVFECMDQHTRNDRNFKQKVQKIPFVEMQKGFVAPETLLNPLDSQVTMMFKGMDVFPTGTFAERDYILKLQGCFQAVSEEKLVLLATFIDRHVENKKSVLIKQGQLLLKYVQENSGSISPACFLELKKLRWVPVKNTGPKFYPPGVPWFGEQHLLSAPASLGSKEHEYVIGSLKPFSECILSEELSQKLHCDSKPLVEDVITHLENIVKYFKMEEMSPVMMLKTVYSYMAAQDTQQVQSCLGKVPKWIWADGRFRSSDQVTLELIPVKAEPYVVQLSQEFSEWKGLFVQQGVKQRMPLENVLVQIKKYHDSGTSTKQRSMKDLSICIDILKYLQKDLSMVQQIDVHDLPVPTHSKGGTLKLVEAKHCTFIDAENIDDDSQERLLTVHKDVPYYVVKSLGIPNMMTRYLDAQDLEFDSFGQSEPLTTRIHGLLEDYKDGVAVLKELIQNADDAGATEVHFMYDNRDFRNASSSLIDPKMKELQGPALLCYNNERFSEEDFCNIVKLGGATKEKKVDQVGRFGLGFNAVYNLTDVPSFISGNDIVFFDPHVKYLQSVIKCPSKPGIRMSLKDNKEQIRKLRDQFKGFDGILGCDLQNAKGLPTFNGTLFRFPLRTKRQAAESDISDISYDKSAVMALLQVLQTSADHLLLFVQNVRKVIISEITERGKIQDCGVIKKESLKVLRPLQQFQQISKDDRHEWKILQMAKECGNTTCDMHNSFIIEINTSFSRGTLFRWKSTSQETWLISNFVKVNVPDDFKKDCFLPVGSTGMLLKKGSQFHPEKIGTEHKVSGRVFCFLPLPIKTKLPFHINGYFAVTSSRQQLRTQDVNDKSDPNAKWNKWLMEEIVVKALLQGLMDMTTNHRVFGTKTLTECIFDLYPVTVDVADELQVALCRSFYQLLVLPDTHNNQNNNILPSMSGNWITFASCRYLDRKLRLMTKQRKVADVIINLCKKHLQNQFVNIPTEVLDTMSKLDFSDHLAARKISLDDFYDSIVLCHLDSVKSTERDMLMHFALLDCHGAVDSILVEKSCVPVRGSSRLMKPGELVDPKGPLVDLYSEEDNPFPVWLTRTYERHLSKNTIGELQQALIRLGMRTDDITLSEVVERAKTIASLQRSTGKSRCKAVLKQLKKKLERKDPQFDESAKSLLQTVTFLPVKEKPLSWIYPWKSDVDFISPAECFTEEDMNLVGCLEYIAEFPVGSHDLKLALGYVRKDIPLDTILAQINRVTGSKKTSRLRSQIMADIYDFLNKLAKEDSKTVYTVFKDVAFMAMSDGSFVKPGKCALQLDKHIVPFLYRVPDHFANTYKDLVSALKIVERFKAPVLVSVLEDLHTLGNGRKLSKDNIRVATEIALLLEGCVKTSTVVVKELFLPDSEDIMARAGELCYNDCEWLKVRQERILHGHIPHPVAIALDIKDMRQQALAGHQDGIPFGQSEKLTSRIKGILDSYPCGSEILKEILQNADDAEASKVCFILDSRTHRSKSIFNDEWSKLQGPALLVYNDRRFTEKDLEGIKNLGEGSKENDPVTTGKYGVGFNCVYHITETPMFLTPDDTGKHILVAFDPHCKYVKGSNKSEPGQMYRDVESLKERFPDVFECFDLPQIPQVDLSCGTLFRFPMRTSDMAQHSLIKTEEFTIQKCKTLFEDFSRDMKEYLLFLKSVHEISLLEIKSDNQVIEINGAQLEILNNAHYAGDFVQQLKGASDQINSVELSDLPTYTCKYQTQIRSSGGGAVERWLIVKHIGFLNTEAVTEELQEKFKRKKASLIPQGGVAVKLHPHFQKKDEGRFFCLLPLPGSTGLPVHINGTFILDHESRRSLWQPEKGSKSFKLLWNIAVLTGIVAEAFVDVIEEIASFYSKGTVTYREARVFLSAFESLFPNLPEKDGYLSALQGSLYAALVKQNAKALPVLYYTNMWGKFEEEYPNDEKVSVGWFHVCGKNNEVAYWESFGATADFKVIKHILKNSHFPLVHLNGYIKERLAEFTDEGTLYEAKPKEMLKHFLGQTSTHLSIACPISVSETPFASPHGLKTLVLFCKSELSNYFEGLPMLLMGNGTVHRFSANQDKTLVSKYHTLVPRKNDLFAYTFYLILMDIPNWHRYLKKMNLRDLGTLMQFALPAKMCLTDGIVVFDQGLSKWLHDFWMFVEMSEKENNATGQMELKFGLKEFFKDWCILPVIINGALYCATPSYLELVINLDTASPVSDRLVGIFSALRYPQPLLKLPLTRTVAWDFMTPDVTQKIFITLDQPQQVVLSIRNAMQLDLLDFSVLDTSQRHCLAVYFNDSFSWERNALTMKEEIRDTLLNIPMFTTVFDVKVSLQRIDAVFTVPNTVKKEGMEMWCNNRVGKVYLKHEDDLKILYAWLGIQCLDFVSMYKDHILCHFEYFTEDQRYTHFLAMKRFVEDDIDEQLAPPLLNKLQTTPVLVDETGVLHCVKSFFNPKDELFQEMETRFPKESFHGTDWIDFLKWIGLQYKPEAHHVKSYVERLKTLSQTRPEMSSFTKKCKVLIQTIFKEESLMRQVSQSILNIRFIPQVYPKNSFLVLNPIKQHSGRPFTCFNGSVVYKHGHLCWTQVPILPSFAVPRQDWQCKSLGVLQQPPLATVIQNARTVCSAFPEVIPLQKGKLIKEFTQLTLAYLKLLDYKEQDISAMREIACVPVEENARLIKPFQIIVENIPKEIPPYLYRLPHELGCYADILSHLGASKCVTMEQYLFVLHKIWILSEGKPLNPPEVADSHEALKGFFEIFDPEESEITKFHLLAKDNERLTLLPSNQVMFDDIPRWTSRVQMLQLPFMADLSCQVAIQKLRQVLVKLPNELQPKFLSKIVTEKLSETSSAKTKSPKCEELEERLTSDEFRNGILRIMRHDNMDGNYDDESDIELAKLLQHLMFYEIQHLDTYLSYNEAKIPRSNMSTCFFIERSGEDITVYLSTALQDERRFDCEMFDIINELMQQKLRGQGLLVAAIMRCEIEQIDEKLDILKVRRYDSSSGRGSESHLPKLGTYIPLEFHHLLQPSLCPLRVDEYIGFELLDPLDESPSDASCCEEPVYIYAKVCKVNVPEGALSYLSYTYKIQIGHDEYIEVPACDIYRFSRAPLNSDVTVAECSVAAAAADFADGPDIADLQKIKQDITDILKEAWTLEPSIRKKIIKRLWLKWHPDKNKGREELCNEVFKYIQWAIDQLERGLSLDVDDTDGHSSQGSGYSNRRRHGTGFWSDFNFDGYTRRAQSQSQHQTRFEANYSSHSWDVPPRTRTRNPQPSEAYRWMRQAQYDFIAAAVDTDSMSNYEWACFKYHQAAEKALKSTQFAVDANQRSRTHNLKMLCCEIGDCDSLASELEELLSGSASMRYPDHHSGGRIPHDVYTEAQARRARELTQEILARCQQFIEQLAQNRWSKLMAYLFEQAFPPKPLQPSR